MIKSKTNISRKLIHIFRVISIETLTAVVFCIIHEAVQPASFKRISSSGTSNKRTSQFTLLNENAKQQISTYFFTFIRNIVTLHELTAHNNQSNEISLFIYTKTSSTINQIQTTGSIFFHYALLICSLNHLTRSIFHTKKKKNFSHSKLNNKLEIYTWNHISTTKRRNEETKNKQSNNFC